MTTSLAGQAKYTIFGGRDRDNDTVSTGRVNLQEANSPTVPTEEKHSSPSLQWYYIAS